MQMGDLSLLTEIIWKYRLDMFQSLPSARRKSVLSHPLKHNETPKQLFESILKFSTYCTKSDESNGGRKCSIFSLFSAVCLLRTTVKNELNPFEWQTNCFYSTAVLPFSQFVLDPCSRACERVCMRALLPSVCACAKAKTKTENISQCAREEYLLGGV